MYQYIYRNKNKIQSDKYTLSFGEIVSSLETQQ